MDIKIEYIWLSYLKYQISLTLASECFPLKVWFQNRIFGNHCGVLEVLQLDVLVIAEENCCCFSIVLFLFEGCMDQSDDI